MQHIRANDIASIGEKIFSNIHSWPIVLPARIGKIFVFRHCYFIAVLFEPQLKSDRQHAFSLLVFFPFFLFNQRKIDGTHPVYGLVTPRPSVPVYRPQPPVLIGQFVWQPSPLVWMVHGMANSLPWQLLDTILGDSPCYVRLRGRKKKISSVSVCDVVVLSINWVLTNQF